MWVSFPSALAARDAGKRQQRNCRVQAEAALHLDLRGSNHVPENEDAAASSRANATARSKGCLDAILGAMAQDNVDVVRQFYEAYNARDESRWAPLLTSDFEFRSYS